LVFSLHSLAVINCPWNLPQRRRDAENEPYYLCPLCALFSLHFVFLCVSVSLR
jgi:hypothetical protein